MAMAARHPDLVERVVMLSAVAECDRVPKGTIGSRRTTGFRRYVWFSACDRLSGCGAGGYQR